MKYKVQHAVWKPQYHALTIWECIGELSEEQRSDRGYGGLRPPKAAAVQIHNWYAVAVEEANAAIEKMIRETTP